MTVGAVTVSTVVSVTPAVAFQVFCGEIDRWWRRDLNYRQRSDSVVRFTEAPNRKLVEVTIDGAVDLGEVTRWEPPHMLQMQWRVPVRVQPGPHNTVEVRFEPVGGGTRVTVTHAGWTDLEPGGSAASIIGLWWSNPLVDYRAACASQQGAGT